jgi:hypothetical protein
MQFPELAKSATTGPPELSDSQPERYSQQLAPWQVLQGGVVIMCHPETDIQKIHTYIYYGQSEITNTPFSRKNSHQLSMEANKSRANFLCYTAVFMQQLHQCEIPKSNALNSWTSL